MINILDILMGDNDADALTIRDYLKALVKQVWLEGEGFSGKRPFGNSAWEYELYYPLVKAGVIEGRIVNGYLENVDWKAGRQVILDAIESL